MVESVTHAQFEGRLLRVKYTHLSRAGLRGLCVVKLLKAGKGLGQQARDLKSMAGEVAAAGGASGGQRRGVSKQLAAHIENVFSCASNDAINSPPLPSQHSRSAEVCTEGAGECETALDGTCGRMASCSKPPNCLTACSAWQLACTVRTQSPCRSSTNWAWLAAACRRHLLPLAAAAAAAGRAGFAGRAAALGWSHRRLRTHGRTTQSPPGASAARNECD